MTGKTCKSMTLVFSSIKKYRRSFGRAIFLLVTASHMINCTPKTPDIENKLYNHYTPELNMACRYMWLHTVLGQA